MKYLPLLLLLPSIAFADGWYLFGGVFAYDSAEAGLDYEGSSPNGYYGVMYQHVVNSDFSVEAGVKHESSMPYREKGAGFNGVYGEVKVRIWE